LKARSCLCSSGSIDKVLRKIFNREGIRCTDVLVFLGSLFGEFLGGFSSLNNG
jgi:hypothetical protein